MLHAQTVQAVHPTLPPVTTGPLGNSVVRSAVVELPQHLDREGVVLGAARTEVGTLVAWSERAGPPDPTEGCCNDCRW